MLKKKNILLFLAVTLCLSLSTTQVCPDNHFRISPINEGASLRITRYVGDCQMITIPQSIQGRPIASIGDEAFMSRDIISVVIPNSVTEILYSAFHENLLTSIIIPNSVTTIGQHAFSYNQITSLTLPNRIKYIEQNAFTSNRLTNLTIPDGVTHIEVGAFQDNRITTVTIPNTVTHIEQSAFANNQLTNITIPNSVVSIGILAFGRNPLTRVVIGDNVRFEAPLRGDNRNGIDGNFWAVYQGMGGTFTRQNINSPWTRD